MQPGPTGSIAHGSQHSSRLGDVTGFVPTVQALPPVTHCMITARVVMDCMITAGRGGGAWVGRLR
jgi:hypothetical protein